MNPFQDHLIATVAAVGVLITSGNIQHDRALDLLHQTRNQSAQVALSSFSDVVAQDVRSMGSGVMTGERMIIEKGADRLVFRGTADSTAAARTVSYSWATATAANGREVVRVTREVDGVVRGQSPDLVSFALAPLDASGAPVASGALQSARRVRVRAELATADDAASEGANVRQFGWETEFAPSNLSRRQTAPEAHPLLDARVALTSFGS